MTTIKKSIVLLLFMMPLLVHAQLWNEIVALQTTSKSDSFACGVDVWCKNSMSKIEGREYTSGEDKKLSYLNPLLAISIAYDFSWNTTQKAHVILGWDGSFYGDDAMTRFKCGIVYNNTLSLGVMCSKRIVADKNGDFLNRYGKYRHDVTYGLCVEQRKESFSLSLSGEYSKKRIYHFAEFSTKLTEYPRWWLAFGSESLRGYGPKMYYKMVRHPVWLQFSLNLAPPVYRDHENVSTSFQFGFRRMFF